MIVAPVKPTAGPTSPAPEKPLSFGLPPVGPRRRSRVRDAAEPSTRAKLLIYALLFLGAVVLVVPFVFLVGGSLKSGPEAASGTLNPIPRDIKVENYTEAMKRLGLTTTVVSVPFTSATLTVPKSFPALANTVVITTLCVVGQVISCSLVGFGFARFQFRGRALLFMIMLSTMMLPSQVTMIPVFVLFRSLGMIDSFWPLVLPAWLASPFFVFMFRQFFSQIPEELMEAARIDGAGNWTIYWRIMLPLCGPVIAIVAIYTFLGTWNDFLGPLIYLNTPENRTLALALNAFNGQYGVRDVHLLMAASVICMAPCVILFFAAQKYFVESVATTGGK